MQKLLWSQNINGYFNHNIEMLRDIAETIGLDRMSNAYDNLSFGMTDGGRIVIMIHNYRSNTYVCAEYQGDGIVTITATDAYGKPIDNTHNIESVFDTHDYDCRNGTCIKDVFHKLLKDKFGIII